MAPTAPTVPTAPTDPGSAPAAASEVTVELRSEFYPIDAVERAVAAFARAAEIRVEAGDPYHVVRIRPRPGSDPERLRHELSNYVLAARAVRVDPE